MATKKVPNKSLILKRKERPKSTMSKEVNYLYHSRNSNTSMTPTELLLFDNNDLHASIPATPLNKITVTTTISFIFNCRQDLASRNAKLFYSNWFMPVGSHEVVVCDKEEKLVNSHLGKYTCFYLLMVQVSKGVLEIIQKFESFWVPQCPCKTFIHVL